MEALEERPLLGVALEIGALRIRSTPDKENDDVRSFFTSLVFTSYAIVYHLRCRDAILVC